MVWRNQFFKRFLLVAVISAFSLGLFVIGLRLWTHHLFASRVYTFPTDVPVDNEKRVAIVFGAGVWRNGKPSPVLYDRIATGVDLYKAGKVRKLIFTGDNRFEYYNEPAVMRETALQMGVPEQDIVLDYAGRRTFDSCFRARNIFSVTRVVLVTQAFHMDRALYLANSVGLDAIGVQADRRSYPASSRFLWSVRELGATVGAWVDLHLWAPSPILGEKISID